MFIVMFLRLTKYFGCLLLAAFMFAGCASAPSGANESVYEAPSSSGPLDSQPDPSNTWLSEMAVGLLNGLAGNH
jgi:hypothetical protein